VGVTYGIQLSFFDADGTDLTSIIQLISNGDGILVHKCNGIELTPTPTPTSTVTPTPTETEIIPETPTPTPTETEIVPETPTPTPTETVTPTPTPTTSSLPINVTFINNSTIASIDSFYDIDGIIPLTNLSGSLPVTSGQTLTGYHSLVTGNQPTVAVTGTGSIVYDVNLNGSTLINTNSTLNVSIVVTSGSVPLQVSDILIVTISDYNP